jgi:hypothetical protein
VTNQLFAVSAGELGGAPDHVKPYRHTQHTANPAVISDRSGHYDTTDRIDLEAGTQYSLHFSIAE